MVVGGVSGVGDFIKYVYNAELLKGEYGQEDAASTALYLVSDLSKGVTDPIIFVDSGYNVMAN